MDVQEDENDNNNQTTLASPKMHSCDVRVTFPTNRQAQYALRVLQVDKEPTDRVTKSMEVENKKSDGIIKEGKTTTDPTVENDDDGEVERIAVLKVHFESSELKMLRVSVSSFYDYLALVVKTFQEFDR